MDEGELDKISTVCRFETIGVARMVDVARGIRFRTHFQNENKNPKKNTKRRAQYGKREKNSQYEKMKTLLTKNVGGDI